MGLFPIGYTNLIASYVAYITKKITSLPRGARDKGRRGGRFSAGSAQLLAPKVWGPAQGKLWLHAAVDPVSKPSLKRGWSQLARYSVAPTSQAMPWGRTTPRWSTRGSPGRQEPLLMAALELGSRPWVGE